MILAIVGSRSFSNYESLCNTIDPMKDKITKIVSGGAKGADRLAEKYAKDNGIPFEVYLPLFKKNKSMSYDPKHFFERNKEIIDNSNFVIAFWDKISKGTKHTIDYAHKRKKPCKVVLF